MAKTKFAKNSAEITADNGEITFIAARSVENMNGYIYDVKSLLAQDSTGNYNAIGSEPTTVSIPLMTDHSSSVSHKIGTIDTAHIENADGVDQVVMHAVFFDTEEAQEIRQRVLDNQLTDVSITTDWGTDPAVWETGNLQNARVVEVSVVYAGAEPKAKILAKNSVEDDEVVEDEEAEEPNEPVDNQEADTEEVVEEAENADDTEEEQETEEVEEEINEEDKEADMPKQPTDVTSENIATKEMVLNSLAKLAQNGAIRKLNRQQVIAAVKNDLDLLDPDGDPYVVPDAVFTEILAATRPTDILETFDTIPVKRFTLMAEVPSEADLARAGRWTKGEQKQIQESDLKAQKFSTQFLYKLQELSYEDLQEDFGDLLYAYVRQELPQKVSEEEERDFIVGDGRATNAPRHISSIVSLDEAADDNTNVHVAKYDGSGDTSVMEAITKGIELLNEDGERHLVGNSVTLGSLRRQGLATANGLPFSDAQVADALGVSGLHKRSYVGENVVYVWTRGYVKRLTGGQNGETIEQYDIDYNNRKIEFIRPVGGGASGLYSAVKITLPEAVSA